MKNNSSCYIRKCTQTHIIMHSAHTNNIHIHKHEQQQDTYVTRTHTHAQTLIHHMHAHTRTHTHTHACTCTHVILLHIYMHAHTHHVHNFSSVNNFIDSFNEESHISRSRVQIKVIERRDVTECFNLFIYSTLQAERIEM